MLYILQVLRVQKIAPPSFPVAFWSNWEIIARRLTDGGESGSWLENVDLCLWPKRQGCLTICAHSGPQRSLNDGTDYLSRCTEPLPCTGLAEWEKCASPMILALQILNRWILPSQGRCTINHGILVIHQLDNSHLMQTHYSGESSSMWNRRQGQRLLPTFVKR